MAIGDGFLHPDRLLPPDPGLRDLARDIYEPVRALPIVNPLCRTDPQIFVDDEQVPDPVALLISEEPMLLRLIRSQGIPLETIGHGQGTELPSQRAAWRKFAACIPLFSSTAAGMRLDHVLSGVFGLSGPLTPVSADDAFDKISVKLASDAFKPSAFFKAFGIEQVATCDRATAPMIPHVVLSRGGGTASVSPSYCPDILTDPAHPQFKSEIEKLGEQTQENVSDWNGLLNAHRSRRALFRRLGATTSCHTMAAPRTADLGHQVCQELLDRALKGTMNDDETLAFRAQMLTEMAGLSVEDGLIMQVTAGIRKATAETGDSPSITWLPAQVDWIRGLSPLLEKYGSHENLRLIVHATDPAVYQRDLAPMAGYWPALMLGTPRLYLDTPEGLRAFLENTGETAGFGNLVGYAADTRGIFTLPAHHDMWRRVVASVLAERVAAHRLRRGEADRLASYLSQTAATLAYGIQEPMKLTDGVA